MPQDNYIDAHFQLDFKMSRDQIAYDRHDYTALSFLADVSALLGAQYTIAYFMIFTVLQTGVLLDNHIINVIFRQRVKG